MAIAKMSLRGREMLSVSFMLPLRALRLDTCRSARLQHIPPLKPSSGADQKFADWSPDKERETNRLLAV